MVQKGYGFLFSSILVGSLSLLAHPAYAGFPLPPRVSALALASDYTVGQADLMLPVRGNANQNLYVDPALSYGTDNQNEFDVGVGYRWIANQAAIVGGYLYGGYSRVDNNARLWVVNPGIEALGSRWDAHLNVYFPMGDRHYTAGTRVVPFFTGHSQFGRVFLIHQYAGSGADIKAGYQLFPNSSLKGYVGSYYFSPAETNNVWGGAAGLEYWLTQGVKLVGSYTYDKLHQSTYALGLGLEWGGTRVHRADPVLDERLTDPVERNLAELGRGSTIPTRLKAKPLLNLVGQPTTILFANNIAFFSQTGGPNNGGIGLSLANCTFENPCGPNDFTQVSVNTLGGLLPGTQFFFNGGGYNASGNVTLVPGQSLRGRAADYLQPATDAERSTLFIPSLILTGNNTLENIILGGGIGGGVGAGIREGRLGGFINDVHVTVSGQNNVISGSQIGLLNDTFASPQAARINNMNDKNLLIDNTAIISQKELRGTTEFGFITGIFADSGSNTAIQNSQITTIIVPRVFPAQSGTAVAVFIQENATVTLNNVMLQAVSLVPATSDKDPGSVAGVALTGGRLNATNTNILASGIGDTTSGIIATSGLEGETFNINFRAGVINISGFNAEVSRTFRVQGSDIVTTPSIPGASFAGSFCVIGGNFVSCSS